MVALDYSEEWMPVLGHEGIYEVSNFGRVRSLARFVARGTNHLTITGRLLSPAPNIDTKYHEVRLSKDGRSVMRKVSILVCEAFHGPRPFGKHAAHRNGNRSDDRTENVQWLTPRENAADKVLHGTQTFGEDHHNAVMTERQVHETRRLRRLGMTYQAIADRLSVTFEMVRCVIVGRSWSHLKEPVHGL